MLFSLYIRIIIKKEGTPSFGMNRFPLSKKYIPKEVSRYYDTHF